MNVPRSVFRTFTVLGRALADVPAPVADALAHIGGDLLFRLRADQRDTVVRNLRRVVGPGADQALLDRWARRSFHEYARYWVEGARLASTEPSEVLQHFVVEEGLAHLVGGMERGNGVVMALPHVGSWEFGGAWLAAVGYPMTAVAERIEPPELFDYFVEQREAMGLRIIPLGPDSGKQVLRALRSGALVGLLCDRDLNDDGMEVEFFGEKTTMPAGPATLALRTGATLLTTTVYRGPGEDRTAVIDAPVDCTRSGSLRADAARVTQEIATRFETAIRRRPEQWHLFQPLWVADRQTGAGGR